MFRLRNNRSAMEGEKREALEEELSKLMEEHAAAESAGDEEKMGEIQDRIDEIEEELEGEEEE